MTTLHTAIATDLEEALPLLGAAGFVVQSSDYDADAFGNYVAEFVAPHAHYRIIRDRGQYILDGPQEILEPHDLWRAYDSKADFIRVLTAFISDSRGEV